LNEWIIHNLVDIFKIDEKREEILEFEWFQEKSVENLIVWVEKAKNLDVATLITALWIAWVWKKTAKTLARLFKSEQDLLNFWWNIELLEHLDDIWPEIAKNVIEYFGSSAHMFILKGLVEILNITYYENKVLNNDSIFFWKKVCITWSFEKDWKKIARDDLVTQLEEKWGNFVSSVSKNTDYLLAGEKAWSKAEKAGKLWVEIIDLDYFLENI